MPTRKFALEPGGAKRLEISWKGIWKDTIVRVDGSQVGTFPNRDALIKGSTFTLVDGSTLGVQYFSDLLSLGLHITYNGNHIPMSTGSGDYHLRNLSGLLFLLAMIKLGTTIFLPIKKAAGLSPDILNAENVVIGLIYLACALPIRRAWMPAVWITAAAAAADSLFISTNGILTYNTIQIFAGLVFAGCLALLLARIVIFLRRERATAAAVQLR